MGQRHVAILIFDGVEVFDFYGPFEVFSITGNRRRVLSGGQTFG